MRINTFSTLGLNEMSRMSSAHLRAQAAQLQQELSSGRVADLGVALGASIGGTSKAQSLIDDIAAISQTNELVKSKMSVAQSALAAMADLAQGFLDTALLASQVGSDTSRLAIDARARLDTLTDLLGTQFQGDYVFSGTNAGTEPTQSYFAQPPGAGRSAVLTAFSTNFGFGPQDAQAASIVPHDMEAFLSGAFDGLFQEPAWSATFSEASSEVQRDRISLNEVVASSVTANDAGFRDLFAALTAAVDAGGEHLSAETFKVLAGKVSDLAGSAASRINALRAELGSSQERLAKACERISVQKSLLTKSVEQSVSVDTADTAQRMTLVLQQLEVSMLFTTRLQRMSLANYL